MLKRVANKGDAMKKRILITMYDMEIGGAERSLINMLHTFDYEQYHVDLFICHHVGEFIKLIPAQVNVLPEVEAYTTFRKSIKQSIQDGYLIIPAIRVISKLIGNKIAHKYGFHEGSGYVEMQLVSKYAMRVLPYFQKEYDVAISYAWPHDIVASKVQAKKKIAWIHTDYSTLEVQRTIDLEMWSKFDCIVAVSEECKNAFLTAYPELIEQVMVIENITSPQFIKDMSCEDVELPLQKNGEFYLVSVGRLSHAKGFDNAIQALRLLHNKGYTNIKWYVVGYGGEEKALRQLIHGTNLENSFVLLGKQLNPYPYIQVCDLYVQPSRYEGKAVTVTEAKILGKPILITNYPTAKSQLNHLLEGMICEGNVEALAEAIESLYLQSELREKLSQYVKSRDYSNSYELDKLYDMIN